MTAVLQHPAVQAYLSELRDLLAGSPDRDLVIDGVTRHIEDEVASGADAQTVLSELGDPAVIAAEAAPSGGTEPAAPIPPTATTGLLERRAGQILVVLLVAFGGFVVPFVGWAAGIVLLWMSKGWTLLDKLVGTFAAPLLAAIVLLPEWLWGALGGGSCRDGLCVPNVLQYSHLLLLAAAAITPILSAVYLLLRFRPGGRRPQ